MMNTIRNNGAMLSDASREPPGGLFGGSRGVREGSRVATDWNPENDPFRNRLGRAMGGHVGSMLGACWRPRGALGGGEKDLEGGGRNFRIRDGVRERVGRASGGHVGAVLSPKRAREGGGGRGLALRFGSRPTHNDWRRFGGGCRRAWRRRKWPKVLEGLQKIRFGGVEDK